MHSATKKIQQGSALLVLVALILAAMSFVIVKALNNSTEAGRTQTTTANMTKAKEALVGFAASYRDSHTAQVNGYLPLPDLGSNRNTTPGEGITAGNFTGNAFEISAVGRLPWKTLGLDALRDESGECLWYAVSGTFQEVRKSRVKFMNWDTLGQFDIYTSNGTAAGTISTVGANYHQRPAAIIIAAKGITGGQTRTPSAVDTVTECGGNYDARNYLDTFNANPLLNNIVNYFSVAPNNSTDTFTFAAPKRIINGSVSDAGGNLLSNDMVLAITADDIFRVIKQRSDFANFVDHDLLFIAQSNLSLTLPPPVTINFNNLPPTETAVTTATGSLDIGRVPSSALTTNDLKAWQDNLLYARCHSGTGCISVTDASTGIVTPNCTGIVIFTGDRLASQTRGRDTQKNTWSNYLENDPAHAPPINVLTAFTNGIPTFTGYPTYTIPATTTSPSFDVLACIQTTPAAQTSFAADFGSFIPVDDATKDTPSQTVKIFNSGGTSGGCLWLPNPVTLAGKSVRSYYEYQFDYTDTFAVTGSSTDRGNGITMDIVDGTQGSPTSLCGRATDMGAFISTVVGTPGDTWALESFTIETDVYRDASDSVENHTAIMAWGNLAHGVAPGSNGYLTSACNGTAAGCRFTNSPSHPTWVANQFEESLTPSQHNQRVEIHSGCNSTCSTCNPASHVSPNTYVKISVWVDCTDCNDVTTDSITTPTINRCINLTPELNAPYIALTGGFRSGAAIQSVTLSNFILRSE